MWRQRARLEAVLGAELVRWRSWWPAPDVPAVAGWGHKPTASPARRLAARLDVPYVAIEDGFLRSIEPGPGEVSLSYLIDHSGVHYDATRPCDLETAIAAAAEGISAAMAERAQAGMKRLRALRLSKYNAGTDRKPAELGLAHRPPEGRILVVDQTDGDASIAGGLATRATFRRMLEAAIVENPGADIVVKVHPDTIAGLKRGCLPAVGSTRFRVIGDAVNPWTLIEASDKVYVVSSQLGFEALLAGRKVVCFGAPFYAGWGLTDDRVPIPRRTARPSLEQLFAAAYIAHSRYACAYHGRPIAFEEAVEQLAFLRDRYHEVSRKSYCLNISLWKRKVIAPYIRGRAGVPAFPLTLSGAVQGARRTGGQVVTWASRCTPAIEAACERAGVPLVRIEDGFIRSVGLGAAYNRGYSATLDKRGMHYDAKTVSDLEHLLQNAEISPDLLARARRLRREIVRRKLTKYNVGSEVRYTSLPEQYFDLRRTGILVPGQVEDDASVRAALEASQAIAPGESINLALLRAVRARNPFAHIVYKPHPDVTAGLRKGRITDVDIHCFADRIARTVSVLQLIEECDQVETLSSLTGFEALLRGKPVVTHGTPFYSGWGLTTDLRAFPRRVRRLSLDELVAGALILYPRYLDPGTLRPCPVERLVDALGTGIPATATRAPLAYPLPAE